jgi:hypothetical protein
MECIICAYKFNSSDRLPALTECDHNNICSFCFLRMRALQKNFSCPTCKRDLEHVICCEKKDATFGEFTMWGDSIGEDFILDQKSRMFLPKNYTKNVVDPLWVCKCNTCPQVRRDLKSLRGHLTAEHNLQLCMLCAENKQAFPSEQKIYTQAQYEKHLKKGDGDGSSGHPNCEFCRKRFYDSTALFVHLNKDHYTCHLCDKAGIKFKYYNNYKDVESHYRKDHYLCEERACLEKQFMAFANEIDLAAHNMTWHPSLQNLGGRRTIPVGFKSRRDEQQEQPSSRSGGRNSDQSPSEGDPSSTGGSRFEGGLGGRAVEGEWQVELQPLGAAGDPRDPLRNLSTGAIDSGPLAPSEDFPALMSSAAPVGSFYSGVATNKWVGIGGSGGGKQGGKNRKGDFPELKSSGGGAKGKLSAEERQNLGLSAKKGQAQAAGNVSNISSEYAQASTFNSGSQQPMGGALSNWANVKVDKRLQKSKASKAIAANGGVVPASSSSGQSAGPTPGFSSSQSVRAAVAPPSEQESYDLAVALSASMAATTASSNSGSDASSDAQKWAPPPSSNWQKVEPARPPAPPTGHAVAPPPPPSSSEEAFPTLLGSEQNTRKPPQSKGQGSAGLKVNHNLLAMTSMLKAAGVSGGTASSRGASKLSVVKQPKKALSSGYVGGSGGSSSSSASIWAPAPPAQSVSSMTAIGKRSNDNLSALGAAESSSYKAGGSTVGWAKIGGAGK